MIYSQNKNSSNNLIMKRLIFSLLFVSTIFISSAQDKSEHLSFKGVPIDGTLNEYVSKMKAAGFSYLGTQDGTAILQGDFAGFKSCTVGVSTLKAVNVVSTIGVIFPSHDDWSSLERDYDHLKSMLTVVFQKVCLGRCLQILQICKYSDSWFQNNTPRRVVLLFVL